MSSARRIRSYGLAWSVMGVIVGCAGGDAGPTTGKPRDAGAASSAGGGAVATACVGMRCASDETRVQSGKACRCTHGGVRMRLGDSDALAHDFYAQPWPLATRLRTDGTLDLDGFPSAAAATFVRDNLALLARNTRGFGTNGALFASFDGALDAGSLPASAADSLAPASAVFLLDIDPRSPDRATRTPITCAFKDAASDYHPAHFLACLPVPGFALRPDTLYGLYLTDALHAPDGKQVVASQRWQDILDAHDADATTSALIDAYAPFVDEIARDGMDRARIVGGSVFRTQDPVSQMRAIAAQVRALDAPALQSIAQYSGTLPSTSGNYAALQGSYFAPIFQQGQTPYATTGGDIRFAPDGTPSVATEMALRFGLTIPSDAPMPASGWPIVLYHHGTGGDAFSFIDDGSAFRIAAAGVATIGIDAPVHGARNPDGGDPSLLFFNVNNLLAMRDNVREGAADLLVLERFVQTLELTAADSPTGQAVRFDPERIFLMGHSQGGLTAPLMAAVSQQVKGMMLSGAGASITMTLLYKTDPLDIPALAKQFLALPADEELDAYHPALALVQAFTEISDSSNYAPYFYRWEGGHGLDVWATQGLLDKQVPPPVTDALVTAIGLSPMQPLVHEIEGLALRQIDALPAPVSANTLGSDGERYTGVYSQYPDDGHFAIFDNPIAQAQLTHWFDTLAHQGRGELFFAVEDNPTFRSMFQEANAGGACGSKGSCTPTQRVNDTSGHSWLANAYAYVGTWRWCMRTVTMMSATAITSAVMVSAWLSGCSSPSMTTPPLPGISNGVAGATTTGAPIGTATGGTSAAAAGATAVGQSHAGAGGSAPGSGGDVKLGTGGAAMSQAGSGGMGAAGEQAGAGGEGGSGAAGAGDEVCTMTIPPSMDCGAKLAPGDRRSCMLGTRQYEVYAGKTLNPCKPVPLVIDAHGATETAVQQAGEMEFCAGALCWHGLGSGWKAEADTPGGGFIVVFPQGINNVWDNTDADFMVQIVAEMKKNNNIDEKKVYISGISNGGALTYWTGCPHSDVFHGMAPHSAGDNCTAVTQPIPVIQFDDMPDFAYQSSVDATNTMVMLEHCQGGPKPWVTVDGTYTEAVCRSAKEDVNATLVPCNTVMTSTPLQPTTCKMWDQCDGNVEIVFCEVAANTEHGAGNEATDGHIIYENNTILNTPSLAWRFFKRFW